MACTDTIADMLTRIRNALAVKFNAVELPLSKMREQILIILKAEGYIGNYEVVKKGNRKFAKVELKYGENGEKVIHEINRVSKPGRRIYITKSEIPRFKNGYGTVILSTNSGILTGKNARKKGVGGELLCEVW
ncbi:MAG: 30S ribosomal protein S8 [Candidatus Margulisbacteria bacterium]|nr:30S ribosomal protein S8 [Candidatus Margulisiibacteriota bacterium]